MVGVLGLVEQHRQFRKWGKDLGWPGDNKSEDDLSAVVVVVELLLLVATVVWPLLLPGVDGYSYRYVVPEGGMSNEYLLNLSWPRTLRPVSQSVSGDCYWQRIEKCEQGAIE